MAKNIVKGMMGSLANKLLVLCDPELRRVSGIIRASCGGASGKESDRVFIDRLARNPAALKMSFWADHFEWLALKEYPHISGRVLDFGCGSGHSDIFLARAGMTVHGIDTSPAGIAIAKDLQSRETAAVRARLSFSVADVTRDQPADGVFDAVWASHVFEHIPEPGPVLDGLRNWVKPGARLLISVPLGLAYDDPGHVNHFFDERQFRTYLGRHAELVERVAVSEEHRVMRILCRFK